MPNWRCIIGPYTRSEGRTTCLPESAEVAYGAVTDLDDPLDQIQGSYETPSDETPKEEACPQSFQII